MESESSSIRSDEPRRNGSNNHDDDTSHAADAERLNGKLASSLPVLAESHLLLAETGPLTNQSAASAATDTDSMDMTRLKDSMEATLRQHHHHPQDDSSLPPPPPPASENCSQDQLRAMYMAGFQAARDAQATLRHNFETAKTETSETGLANNSSPPLLSRSSSRNGLEPPVVIPLLAGAAGVVTMGQQSPAAARMNKSRLSSSLNDSDFIANRRVPRTASLTTFSGAARSSSDASNTNTNNNNHSNTSSNAASPALSATKSPRGGGGACPFPRKLMEMLATEDNSVVDWLPTGDAFVIRDVDKFMEIVPRYFRHTKMTSFQRQLNLYGFRRVAKGVNAGAYYNESFQRDRPDLCLQMKRCKQKGTASPLLKGRARSDSVTSSPMLTPDASPSIFALDAGDDMMLSQSAPSVLSSIGRAAQISSRQEGERHSDFRHDQQQHLSSSFGGHHPTGLSLLVNGGAYAQGNGDGKPLSLLSTMGMSANITDAADRESQARSLAAAGMAADRFRLSQPMALQPPPMLASPNLSQFTSSSTEVDNVNYTMIDLGSNNNNNNTNNMTMNVDDLDLDFATLFDPALEEANMQMGELSGWPSPGDPSLSLSPNRISDSMDENLI